MLSLIIALRAELAQALSSLRIARKQLSEIQQSQARGTAISAGSLANVATHIENAEGTVARAETRITS